MKNHMQIFWLLILAYTASIVYQYYRFTLNQLPEFDTFGVTEIIGYSILFCWSGLALIKRKWAIWTIIILCSIQLFVAFFVYIPIIFVKRHDTFWDWAENIVFISLIAFAGYKALLELRVYKEKASNKNSQTAKESLDTASMGI